MDGVRITEQTPEPEPKQEAPGGPIEGLIHFDGPPDQFLAELLRFQCRVADAEGGAILRAVGGEKTEILAIHPVPAQDTGPPAWLTQALQDAPGVFRSGQTSVKPLHDQTDLYGQPARRHVVAVPLRSEAGPTGAAAFVVQAADPDALAERRQRLELTVALLSLYEMRLTLQRRQMDFRRLRSALEILASVNEHDRFAAGAMAFCNEIASRHQCDRVGLGFLKGRYVALKAMGFTEKFSRKMRLVQDIEAAMEECLDQDMEILHPAPPETASVSRAARELSTRHGPTTVASLPMRREGEVVAVATLERPIDRPFGPQEIETLRLTCELATPRLVNLHKHDRWFGARAAGAVGKVFGTVLGPKHTWVKLLALAVVGLVVFLTFAKGTYRAEAPFVFRAIEQRVVPAPFDGYIKSAEDVLGKHVGEGELLAELETADLELELDKARLQRERFLTEAKAAREAGETAKMQIAQAQAREAAATIRLLSKRIQQARITSPISGRVVKIAEGAQDLASQIGAPVKTGNVLFEIAKPFLADLRLPSDRVGEVRKGMKGELAPADDPDEKIPFEVVAVTLPAEGAGPPKAPNVRIRLLRNIEAVPSGTTFRARVVLNEQSYGTLPVRPIPALRAELSVPEDLIADVKEGMKGDLASAAHPKRKIPFVVERINPVAEVVNQRNVFKVRVRLVRMADWMRPGMEGLAKVDVGERAYGWIWTRRLVNWVRMKLWW